MAGPTVSVVLIAYNQEREIDAALAALARQTHRDFQLVAVDNNSSDRTGSVIRRWLPSFERAVVVDAREGQGASYARNTGIAAAEGEYLCFLDGDDYPADDWLEHMVDAAPRGDIIGGQLDKRALNPPHMVGNPIAFTQVGGLDFSPLAWVIGANMAAWRHVFDRVGLWPTGLVSSEDVLLCLRAQAAGMTVAIADGAVVHYRLRTSLRALLRAEYRYGLSHAQLRSEVGDPVTRRSTWRDVYAWVYAMRFLVPAAARKADARSALARNLAQHAGRLAGSVRYRVLIF